MSSPNTDLSVCIARVFKNIPKNRIHESLDTLALGDIERIDLVKSRNPQFNTAFVHYHRWNPDNMEIREAIVTGKKVKVIYDDPWFWLLSLSRSVKPTFESKSVPKIVIGTEDEQPKQPASVEPASVEPASVEPASVEPAGTPPPSEKNSTKVKNMSHEDLVEMTSAAC